MVEWKFHTAKLFQCLTVVIDTLQLARIYSLTACVAMSFLV